MSKKKKDKIRAAARAKINAILAKRKLFNDRLKAGFDADPNTIAAQAEAIDAAIVRRDMVWLKHLQRVADNIGSDIPAGLTPRGAVRFVAERMESIIRNRIKAGNGPAGPLTQVNNSNPGTFEYKVVNQAYPAARLCANCERWFVGKYNVKVCPLCDRNTPDLVRDDDSEFSFSAQVCRDCDARLTLRDSEPSRDSNDWRCPKCFDAMAAAEPGGDGPDVMPDPVYSAALERPKYLTTQEKFIELVRAACFGCGHAKHVGRCGRCRCEVLK